MGHDVQANDGSNNTGPKQDQTSDTNDTKPDSRSQEVVRGEAKRKLHASNAARKDTLPINALREPLTKIRMKRKK
jgi:hypothetical protein